MSKDGKRDFGSFHASNVQELLAVSEEDYKNPELPVSSTEFLRNLDRLQFGSQCKKSYFLLEENCVFLNHGAFGAVLKGALSLAQEWQSYIERQPLCFFDRELLPFLAYVTRCLAKFVGSDASDIVLVTNATTAINSVVRSMDIQRGDTVFTLNLTYGAVKKLLHWTCDHAGALLQEETVQVPVINKDQIVTLIRDTLKEGTKLAVFDHVPSNTPFILPIEEIVQICRERNVPVLIDGAHALGMLPLDMKRIKADFYVSNAHKWFCCPKGSAFMYVRKELQSKVRPLVISHGFGSGFNSEFIWAGLHDYSPFLVMPALIEYWKTIGSEKVREYMHSLCRDAGKLLQEMWGTTLAAPPDMFGSMCLVGLPESLYKNSMNVTYESAEEIQNELFHRYNIEVPIKAVQGRLYVRISCHIHNELDEYKILVCAADPDLFPKDCHHVICGHDNKNDTCCFHSNPSDGDQKSFLDTSMVVVFFMAVTGSLLLLISIMYCSARLNRKCTDRYQQHRRRRDVSTSSAGVQTIPPDPSTLPPPYVWSTESSNLTEVSIPRCPSYIKDPPQYGTWTLADKYDTSDNTNEDDSHQGIEMITNTTPEPDVVTVVCPSMTQENDSINVERNTTIENTNV